MANRQALRDLQTRLAERLQAARTNNSQGASWLAVQAGGRNYLLPLEQAGEIFPWPGVSQVPYTTDWFWGVANLRGNLAGVVDLAAYLGHPVERSEQSLHSVSLLVINPALQVNVALVVDQLLGLRKVEDFVDASPQSMQVVSQPVKRQVHANYVDSEGKAWEVLSLHGLAQSPDFLRIRL